MLTRGCKHTMTVDTVTTVSAISVPAYACVFCEIDRLNTELRALRAADCTITLQHGESLHAVALTPEEREALRWARMELWDNGPNTVACVRACEIIERLIGGES